MPKKAKSKVSFRHSDHLRSILTDTSPFEVPLIYSNDGFYKNLSDLDRKSTDFQKLVCFLVIRDRKFSIPLRYKIVKDATSFRRLSLLHPNAQFKISAFYKKYDQVICEYTTRSPFSIRYPQKVGTSYFVSSPFSDKNKYKADTVDTANIEKLVRNPATYFSYYGYDRLYKFFKSNDHIRLEKKFKNMISLDVSKCFDSIYTHSFAWAVTSIELAKENIGASTFGNNFDLLMQNSNYNETSGICIGPELSRIFAEIILGAVDKKVEIQLEKMKIFSGVDYECRRYVDNFYVFSNSSKTLKQVEIEISTALGDFNLHLHSGKKEEFERPFYTDKSLATDLVNKSIISLKDSVAEAQYFEGKKYFIPTRVRRHEGKLGSFIREIKAACSTSNLGYDAVSNVIVSAMKNFSLELLEGHRRISSSDGERDKIALEISHYRQVLLLSLDISFYFFTLHPTASSSHRLSHSVVLIAQYLAEHDVDGFEQVKEYVMRWTSQLIDAPSFSEIFVRSKLVPIEFLNVLLSLQEFSSDGFLESQLLSKAKFEGSDNRYFQVIVKLFIFANHPNLEDKKEVVINDAIEAIFEAKNISQSSESTHLLLDLLSCPFINPIIRRKLLLRAREQLNEEGGSLPVWSNNVADGLVAEFEQQHWFTWWKGINLLNLIEKKEQTTIY